MKPSDIIKKIEVLIKPNSENGSSLDPFKRALEATEASPGNLQSLKPILNKLPETESFQTYSWWPFAQVVLSNLLELKHCFEKSSEEDNLLSISQKKILKGVVEIFISLTIVPNLSKGIGISVQQRSVHHELLISNLNLDQKYICLMFGAEGVLSLYEEETFRGIIVSSYFGDILSSLFQLIIVDKNLNLSFPIDKDFYRSHLIGLIERTYQPLVLRELMMLNGNRECPQKLSRMLRTVLTERLMVDGGVVSILRAILEIAGDSQSPRHWNTVSILARLVITPHTKDVDKYYSRIVPQVLPLLMSNDQAFMQISVTCIRHLYEKNPELCEKYFLSNLLKPLKEITSEDSITECINALFNCFAIPHSEFWALPVQILAPLAKQIFRLHFKVCEGVCHIKPKVEDLLWFLVLSAGEDDFTGLFEALIFPETDSQDVFFEFGESGGVILVRKNEKLPFEESSDCLLSMVLKRDLDGKVKTKLFKTLIKTIGEEMQEIEKRAVAAKMLSALSSDPLVLKFISSDPSCIIQFLKVLLERKLDPCSFDTEIICLGLMVLSVILGDSQKLRNWKQFECLVEPLRKLKEDSASEELKLLAEEIYCLILSQGIVTQNVLNPDRKKENNKKYENLGKIKNENKIEPNACEKAIKEACDGLLPVRGHGMRELAKLLLAGDKYAKAKKETILCLFKENLKDPDSYLYLSAIDGMASLASAFPDDVLITLTEQFVYCKEPELRLKVGEVLLRVSRNLGEMVFVYKAELLNALLHGCRDPDPIVRASSLSNLGEICKILTFRIGVLAVEIFECIRSIFETDPAPEARRAAVMVLTLILKGLGPDALSVLESVLVELYRKLRLLYHVEKDEITKLHAQLALEELNSATLSYLRPKPQLSKRIFMLDPSA